MYGSSKQRRLISSNVIIDQSEFDENVWKRAQINNNSGYLDEEYQVTREFPQIGDYHFRVQDDQTILEFQKLSMQDSTNQPINFTNGSDKFHSKLASLLQTLDHVHPSPSQPPPIAAQSHGYYSLDKQYDNESSIKQAFSRIQSTQIQEKMNHLSINQKAKPRFIKKQKLAATNTNQLDSDSKMVSQQSIVQRQQTNKKVKNLNKQFNQLSINEDDL